MIIEISLENLVYGLIGALFVGIIAELIKGIGK